MNKSTLSVLMAALMATSGFVAAQTAPASGGMPSLEGPVKNTQPADSGGVPANTRAGVKAQVSPADLKAGAAGAEGPVKNKPDASAGNMPANSRADVKAQVSPSDLKNSQEGGVKAETTAASNQSMAERKAKRAERKAMAKAKRDAKMSGTTSMTKPPASTSAEKPQ